MNIDLSDLKEGQEVYCTKHGIVIVNYFNKNCNYQSAPIRTVNKLGEITGSFDFDGIYYSSVFKTPDLFHSIEECIEYFQHVKKEMDEANKSKKRYWIWSWTDTSSGAFFKSSLYMDDNFLTTNGNINISLRDSDIKIKHENEFIDV